MKNPSTTCFCDICDKIFSGNDTLLYHIKTQHKELLSSGYKCDICKITLFDSDKEKHMERCYKNLKGAKCHICDKTFSNKQKVLKHVLNQHKTVGNTNMQNQQSSKCKKCGNFFLEKFKHDCSTTIKKIKNFKCDKCKYCGKFFSEPVSLTRHINIVHEGQRKFHCDICLSTFTSKENYKNHISKAKLKCNICNQEFCKMMYLNTHIKQYHLKRGEKSTEPRSEFDEDKESLQNDDNCDQEDKKSLENDDDYDKENKKSLENDDNCDQEDNKSPENDDNCDQEDKKNLENDDN